MLNPKAKIHREDTKAALDESHSALNQAENDVTTAMIDIKKVEQKFEKSFRSVDEKILNSNENLALLKKDLESVLARSDEQIGYLN